MEIKTRVKDFFTREKIVSGFKNQFTFSVQEIAFAGIFVALWIVSSKFITIDFGVMRAGLVYVWAILIGLITKPFAGVITAIIADTISLAISKDGMGAWMWEYAIIYPLITLFASAFKHTFKIKNKYVWWSTMVLINIIAMIGAFAIALHKAEFKYVSKNQPDAALDFTQSSTKIAIWICMGIMFAFFIALGVVAFKFEKYKNYLAIFTLVAATIVLFIWVWGPIAQVRYLERYVAPKSGKDYWKLYDIYLFGRVLKTPVILPLYTAIIGATYFAYQQVEKFSSVKHKW